MTSVNASDKQLLVALCGYFYYRDVNRLPSFLEMSPKQMERIMKIVANTLGVSYERILALRQQSLQVMMAIDLLPDGIAKPVLSHCLDYYNEYFDHVIKSNLKNRQEHIEE